MMPFCRVLYFDVVIITKKCLTEKKFTEKSAQSSLTTPVDNGAPTGTNAIGNDNTEVKIVKRHSCISAKAEKNKFHNL